MPRRWLQFTKGILRENPVLVLLLGICPTLAVTTSVTNAVGMGISATFVLIGSNLIISIFGRFFPKSIRIPCYIVVIATFVTIVKMVLAGFVPELNEALGIFIPLIVVNCIILGRAEAFASRNGAVDSLLDALGMGAGFTLALLVISTIREVLGSWRLAGVPITDGGFDPVKILGMAPGAFIVLGLVLATVAALALRKGAVRQAVLAGEEHAEWEAVRPDPEAFKRERDEKKRREEEKKRETEASKEEPKPPDESGGPEGGGA
jgi:electron transport complex protein RnfE